MTSAGDKFQPHAPLQHGRAVPEAALFDVDDIRPIRGFRILLWALTALPLMLYALLGLYQRQEVFRSGMAEVRQTVRILEEHALRVFEAQELILGSVDRNIEGMSWDEIRQSSEIHDILKRLADSSPHVDGIYLVPPDGRTANSADFFPFPEVDVSDRRYFQTLSQVDELHFGEMILGRTKGTANFNVSRRRSPRDTFDGVILVTASLSYFTDFWLNATSYKGIAAGLFRKDGAILTRIPQIDSLTVDSRLPETSPLMMAMQVSDDGVQRTVSSIDGKRRVYGHSRIGATPIFLGFGINETDLLAQWRTNMMRHGSIALLATLLLALAVGTVLRQSRDLSQTARSWRRVAEKLRLEVDRRVQVEDVLTEKDRLLAQLREATAQRKAILDNMGEGVAAFDATGRPTYCNGAARSVLRLGDDALPDFDTLAANKTLVWPDGAPLQPDNGIVHRLLRGETLRPQELRLTLDADADPVYCRFVGAPIRGDDGQITGAVVTFWDITQQKLDEKRRNMLARELDHRVRNMLASIMAMVRIGSTGTSSRQELVETLMGRIRAMARTHGILAQSGWSGVLLSQVVEDEVHPFASAERIRIEEGEQLLLSPKDAVDLALVVHELATNAVKHGAWSRAEGRVEVAWTRVPGTTNRAVLTWRETGGPPVTEPTHTGFGTTLIRNAFRDARAGVSMTYDPAGLICEITVPVRALVLPKAPPAPKPAPAPQVDTRPLAGLRLMVAEDEPIVQMDMIAILQEAGADVVLAASTLTEAREAAMQVVVDAALLDVNLNGESIGTAAEMLHGRGIPIVFTTGYSDIHLLAPVLRGLPMLQKPLSPPDIIARLQQVTSKPTQVR